MRYSANLNVILKAIDKSCRAMPRDFIELENLQSNPESSAKFAKACYSKVKRKLAEDLSEYRPDYNIYFADGDEIINNEEASYSYVIFPIDGLGNFSRSDPHFSVAIALEYVDENGNKDSIAVAVNNIIGNELYYCEKGFGSYVSNRRIRTSRKKQSDKLVVVLEEVKQNVADNILPRSFGCKSLEIAYLACSRIDGAIFKDNKYLKPFMLLAREAGGKVKEENGKVIVTNGVVEL